MPKTFTAAAAIIAAGMLALPAPAAAQKPYEASTLACWGAVSYQARGQFNAGNIQRVGNPRFVEIGPSLASVSGEGAANGIPFTYSCNYNWQTGQTYGVRVTASGALGPGGTYNPGYTPIPPQYPNGGLIPGLSWQKVPAWAIGRWDGYSPSTNQAVSLRIRPDGSITGKVDGIRLDGKIDKRGRIKIGWSYYDILQTAEGLMTQQVGNPSNVVYYHRR